MNGTLQDRLVKALRRGNIGDLESANRFLQEEFLPLFNQRFSVAASQSGDFHRPLDKAIELDRILSVQEERVVQNDWTVRWKNRFLQLPGETAASVQPGMQVTVCELLNGRLRLFRGETELPWSVACREPVRSPKPVSRTPREVRSSPGWNPAANHPWRGRGGSRQAASSQTAELAGSVAASLRSPSTTPANSEFS